MRTIRKPKTKELKAKDFYQTNPAMVQALIDKDFYLKVRQHKILDPCCGKNVIGNVLRKNGFKHINEIDIEQGVDFLAYYKSHDVIIMNPPYSNKYAFIDHALEIARYVYVLLPLDVSNYNLFHREYLNTEKYKGRILMTPKMILHDGIEPKFGGNSSYAWYHFSNDNTNLDKKYEKYADLAEYLR